MLKFDNTCTEYPNLTRVLDEMLYSKRKTQNLSQTVLANLIGRSRNCIQQAECHEHLPAFFTILHLAAALGFSEEDFGSLMLALWMAFQEDLRLQNGTNWKAVERNIRLTVSRIWENNRPLLECVAYRPLIRQPCASAFLAMSTQYLLGGASCNRGREQT